MTILVIADHDGVTLESVTLHTVAAAAELAFLQGSDIHVIVAGHACAQLAQAAAEISGVMKVICVDGPAHTCNLVDAVSAIAARYSHILFSATQAGDCSAVRLANLLKVNPVRSVVKIVSADVFEQSAAPGPCVTTSKGALTVLTVLSTGFRPSERFGHAVLEDWDAGCLRSSGEAGSRGHARRIGWLFDPSREVLWGGGMLPSRPAMGR